MAAGGHWPAGRGADVKSNGIIEFSGPNNSKIDTLNDISVIFFLILVLRRAAGDPWLAGGVANVKYHRIIEISDQNNPKIDAHDDISVINSEFWCDGGGGWPLASGCGGVRKILLHYRIQRPEKPQDRYPQRYICHLLLILV